MFPMFPYFYFDGLQYPDSVTGPFNCLLTPTAVPIKCIHNVEKEDNMLSTTGILS